MGAVGVQCQKHGLFQRKKAPDPRDLPEIGGLRESAGQRGSNPHLPLTPLVHQKHTDVLVH